MQYLMYFLLNLQNVAGKVLENAGHVRNYAISTSKN